MVVSIGWWTKSLQKWLLGVPSNQPNNHPKNQQPTNSKMSNSLLTLFSGDSKKWTKRDYHLEVWQQLTEAPFAAFNLRQNLVWDRGEQLKQDPPSWHDPWIWNPDWLKICDPHQFMAALLSLHTLTITPLVILAIVNPTVSTKHHYLEDHPT